MKSEIAIYCFFTLFLCCANAWSWREEAASKLTMEGAKSADYKKTSASNTASAASSYPWRHFAGSQSVAGNGRHSSAQSVTTGKQQLCESVVAEPNPNVVTQNTAVHICQTASGGACYFSALGKCCADLDNAFRVDGGADLQVGQQHVSVEFYYSGGFGTIDPLRICTSISDGSIKMCDISGSMECIKEFCEENTQICRVNVLPPPEANCDPVAGCECKEGFLGPDCCHCDTTGVQHQGQAFFKSGQSCLPLCLLNCLRSSPFGPEMSLRCLECQPGYKGEGCCECAGDRVRIRGKCECPPGEVESNGQCCPSGQAESNGICCPVGHAESNGMCCPLGQRESNGVCCPVGLSGSNGICCPSGQHESGGICCPVGLSESNGICCPTGHIGSNGICCPTGRAESNGVCCLLGEVGSNGICCPLNQLESNGRCCPIGQSESNGRCCPIGQSESNGICCPTGKIASNGICITPCLQNCASEQLSSSKMGCSQCKLGFASPPSCCNCATGFVKDGSKCVPDVPCGENQDIWFVLDITQSFDVARLRRVIRGLQLITGALDNNQLDLRVMAVHYPYHFSGAFAPDDVSSNFVVSPDANCQQAVRDFDALALDISLSQSEGTDSSAALEFLANNIDKNKPTSILTVTSGISDGYYAKSKFKYPPTKIGAAINLIKSVSTQRVRFFVAGDRTNILKETITDFESELQALCDNTPSHMLISQKSDSVATFIDQILDLLVNGSILCPEQAAEIRRILAEQGDDVHDLDRYAKCIQDITQAVPLPNPIPPCYTSNTCPATGKIQDTSLAEQILEAIEQILSVRGN